MALDGQVMKQAVQLAYLQDFRLIMWMTLVIVPLALILRNPDDAQPSSPASSHALPE
jgi:DHA2 family multidrug resistance protein